MSCPVCRRERAAEVGPSIAETRAERRAIVEIVAEAEQARLKYAVCRSCGAGIGWAQTERGALIPIDLDPPAAGGNVRLEFRGFGDGPSGRPTAIVLDPKTKMPGLYVAHWATCPTADQHRRAS